MLDDLILQDLLIAKAAGLKIEVPATELDAAFAKAKGTLTDDQFKQELTRRSLSEADLREGLAPAAARRQGRSSRKSPSRSPSAMRRSRSSSRPTGPVQPRRRRRITSRRS